jgi:hypothetical protein
MPVTSRKPHASKPSYFGAKNMHQPLRMFNEVKVINSIFTKTNAKYKADK